MTSAVLYVIACGGRPASDITDHVAEWQADGWRVCVIATPSALKFIDRETLRGQTGSIVRYDYKQPEEPDLLPPADAFAIAPATFNTINKLAGGISDNLALGLLNEAIGAGIPVVAVPTPNQALARHPAFVASVQTLRSWGLNLIFDPQRHPLPTPNMGPSAAALFPWTALRQELRTVLDGVRRPEII